MDKNNCPNCNGKGEFKHEDNNIQENVYFCLSEKCKVVLYK
jgi:hypothetical protein